MLDALSKFFNRKQKPAYQSGTNLLLLLVLSVVIGAGVAGLQAIATAKRLGAIVFATDVRQASKEEVESLGGKFLSVEKTEDLETEDGYARETSREFKLNLISECLFSEGS